MVLSHSIEINNTPDAVFSFFEDMEANYLRWHPDHIEFRWVPGRGVREGHVAHYAERIAGQRKAMDIVYTRKARPAPAKRGRHTRP